MRQSIEFKTQTTFMDRPAYCPNGEWVLGLDIGYSAVKGMSPNKVYAFPSYARKIPELLF